MDSIPVQGPGEARPAAVPARGDPLASSAHPLWRRGFRPFFLATAIYGALLVPAWLAIWHGLLPAPRWLPHLWWHGHEMVFGMVGAAIAGFLLTATPVWTGRPALAGRPLMGLVALWAAGRLAMLGAGALPAGLVAAADLVFLAALVGVLARTVGGTGQWRNYGVVAVVGALLLANAAVHAQALGLSAASAPGALRVAVDGVVLLIVVIGGRITPAFTTNALARAGDAARVRSHPWVDRLAVGGVALVALADLAVPRSAASGAVACAAALAVGIRLAGWQTRRIWRDPLLLSLHAGMAWVVLGLLLVGIGDLGIAGGVPATAGLHALAAGAMGAMILAVMTRVAVAHTGRPLALLPGAGLAYVLVHAGALARVLGALAPASAGAPLLLAGGLLWAGAFALFAIVYGPILLGPRVDGKDG